MMIRPTSVLAALLTVGLLAGSSAAQQEPFKIGSIFSVTGPAAFLGDHMKKTVEFYVEKKNKEGGINGRPIQLIVYDAASETTKAVTAAKRLIEQDKVDIVVGGGNMSGLEIAIAPMMEKAQVPFISLAGSKLIATPVEQKRWVFKAVQEDTDGVRKAIDFWKAKGITKVAFLTDTSGFGKSAREEFQTYLPASGIEAVAWEEFDPSTFDLTPQLTRIRGTQAQAVLCWTVTPAGVVFLKNVKQLGMSDRMIMHGQGFVEERYMKMAEDAAEGVVVIGFRFNVADRLPDNDQLKPVILRYKREYKERYGGEPNLYGSNGHEGMLLAAYALEKGGKDKARIRGALETVNGLVGAQRIHRFSATNHRGGSPETMAIIRWTKGQWEFLY